MEEKEVVVFVENSTIIKVTAPSGIKVSIVDFDIDGAAEDRITKTPWGEAIVEEFHGE